MRCFLLTMVSATLRAQVSPIQKVIELLDGLKGKVEAELSHEEQLMSEYSKFCDAEANEREDAITGAKRTVTDLQATMQDSSASVSGLTDETEELAAKIRTADQDLAAATEIRDKERSTFQARENELVETIDTLERAVIVLKRGQTFLQKGADKDLKLLATSLATIVQATWVDSKSRSAVQALLQADDEDLSLQPQATTAAYESKGGSIVEILQDMQTKAEAALSDTRKNEMEEAHSYAMLKQGLDQSSKTLGARKAEASSERSRAEETLHSAEGDLESTKGALSSDTKYLAELKANCEAKSKDWEVRQKEAGEEMGAIAKAKEILEGGVKVFLQQRVGSDDARSKAQHLLRSLQAATPSFLLAQVVSASASDPFGKVKDMIEGLIDRLMKEAGEEADANAFCTEEQAKSKQKQEDLTASVDQHAVRIEKSTAAMAKLSEQIKALTEGISQIDQGSAEATKLRQAEHEEYVSVSAEYKQAADAIANAMQVLQDYYAQGSFLQLKQAPELGGAKTDIASTILSMLEVAEEDFTRLLAESEAAENSAASAYAKLSQENKVARAAKEAEAKGKEAEVKSLELNLLNYKEDHVSASKELDAVLKYQDSLKPQCETKVMTYAERKAKREQEIEGLKNALNILSA